MNGEATIPNEARIFQALMAAVTRVAPDGYRLSALSSEQQSAATAIFFLCDVVETPTVEHFVTVRLGRLLQQLSRQLERPYVVYTGQVHGAIHWQRTIKARHTGEYNPTRYVCREIRRRYDTPENQLLKYLVEQIHASLAAVPGVLRMGACYFLDGDEGIGAWGAGAHRLLPIPTDIGLTRMESALTAVRHHTHYREISLPATITDEHLQRATSSRQEDYAHVAKFYRRYADLNLTHDRAPALLCAGKRVLLLPARISDDGWSWLQLQAAILKGAVIDDGGTK